jgi:hypothetical protein
MLKIRLNLAIVVLILISNFVFCEVFEPLTLPEALNYIHETDENIIADDIIKIDILENTTPIIKNPEYTALLMKNGDLIIFPIEKTVTVTHGHLIYDVNFKTYILKDFGPKRDIVLDIIINSVVGVVCFGIGVGISYLVFN